MAGHRDDERSAADAPSPAAAAPVEDVDADEHFEWMVREIEAASSRRPSGTCRARPSPSASVLPVTWTRSCWLRCAAGQAGRARWLTDDELTGVLQAAQAPGWRVTQPAPGTTAWTTPAGRTHTSTATDYDP